MRNGADPAEGRQRLPTLALVAHDAKKHDLVRLASGATGGDLQIGALIVDGGVDGLIFLRDPSARPGRVDVGSVGALLAVRVGGHVRPAKPASGPPQTAASIGAGAGRRVSKAVAVGPLTSVVHRAFIRASPRVQRRSLASAGVDPRATGWARSAHYPLPEEER